MRLGPQQNMIKASEAEDDTAPQPGHFDRGRHAQTDKTQPCRLLEIPRPDRGGANQAVPGCSLWRSRRGNRRQTRLMLVLRRRGRNPRRHRRQWADARRSHDRGRITQALVGDCQQGVRDRLAGDKDRARNHAGKAAIGEMGIGNLGRRFAVGAEPDRVQIDDIAAVERANIIEIAGIAGPVDFARSKRKPGNRRPRAVGVAEPDTGRAEKGDDGRGPFRMLRKPAVTSCASLRGASSSTWGPAILLPRPWLPESATSPPRSRPAGNRG